MGGGEVARNPSLDEKADLLIGFVTLNEEERDYFVCH
jgi:hypothetical protein